MEEQEIYLVEPKSCHKDAAYIFMEECRLINDIIHGDGELSAYEIYEEWLSYLMQMKTKETAPNGYVPATTYFAMRVADNELIGVINLRYELNDFLMKMGGNIGYSIRPKYRRLGYGKLMLTLVLEKARELNIKKVLITCDKNNLGSAKTILHNNGVLENEIIDGHRITQRYWITL